MKKFAFKLETKLHLVMLQEDQAKEDLRQKRVRLEQEYEGLRLLQNEMNCLEQALRSFNGSTMHADELILYANFQAYLKERIAWQQDRVVQSEHLVEKSRQALIEIMRERKTLDTLKDRRYQEYWHEFMRQEQIHIDEAANRGYLMNSLSQLSN